MSMEVTPRQALLLAILGVALVVIIFGQLLIRPVLADIKESKATVSEAEAELEDLKEQAAAYETNLELLEKWREDNSKESNQLLPRSDQTRIDRLLTFVMNEISVKVTKLDASGEVAYYVDGGNNIVEADPKLVAAALAGDEAAASNASTDGSDVTSYVKTGEYRNDFTYTMQGTYEQMVHMIGFVNSVPYLGLNDFTIESITEDEQNLSAQEPYKPMEDYYEFTMKISAYMYEDPLATEESKEDSAKADQIIEKDMTQDLTAEG